MKTERDNPAPSKAEEIILRDEKIARAEGMQWASGMLFGFNYAMKFVQQGRAKELPQILERLEKGEFGEL